MKSRMPIWAALAISCLAGMLLSAQSRINGGLSQVIDNGYLAAALSFGSGLIVITLVLVLSPRGRAGLLRVYREVTGRNLPWWALSGGACGLLFVLGQGLIVTVIGVAMFTVGIVAGQVLGGLVLDRIGVGPGGRIHPTAQRIIGAVLVVIAVGLTVLNEVTGAGGIIAHLWIMLVPLIIGIGMSWQNAVNGLVRSAARSAITATFVNFAVGTIILVLVACVSVAINDWPAEWPQHPVYYVGGPLGLFFVALMSILVRTIGVLLLGMSNVAGQLIAAVVFDAVAPISAVVTPMMMLGVAVALIAVAIAAIPSRRSSVTHGAVK